MSQSLYGHMPDGTPIYMVQLFNEQIHCNLISYGCTLTSLSVADRNGERIDVLLGYPTLSHYQQQSSYMGALIGRYANRIANASFALNGKEYLLNANDGSNHLHGGPFGFDKQVFQIESVNDTVAVFSRISKDGEEGYPGNLTLRVSYVLDGNSLTVTFSACSDQDSVHSFTLHPYFNLSGQEKGSVLDHYLQIMADHYTPVRSGCIPTGEIASVSGTPFDFRNPHRIGERINQSCNQLELVSGYDHNFVLNGKIGILRKAACAWSEFSGVEMQIETTMPGIQFYSGNFIDQKINGKNGAPYPKRSGFCLEPQQFPDAPNQPSFPSPVLKAGIPVTETIRYSFGVHS